jgi:hypothetical protein
LASDPTTGGRWGARPKWDTSLVAWRRVVAGTALGLIALEAIVVLVLLVTSYDVQAGLDYGIYHDAAARWLAGGGFYLSAQTHGSYRLLVGDVLYPPVILWLLVPFVYLPAFLWWAVPLALTAWAIWHMRPAWWFWPVLLAVCLWPPTIGVTLFGNPALWAVAAVALGCVYGWPSVFAVLKPSMFPFAFIGIRRRSWWVALCVLMVLCLPFWGMWVDWFHVMTRARGDLLYSLNQAPLLAVPIAAHPRFGPLVSSFFHALTRRVRHRGMPSMGA